MNWNILSESFVLACKRKQDIEVYVSALKQADWNMLNNTMVLNEERLAFWINIYNAFIQIEAEANSQELITHKHLFFTKKRILIGNRKLSFDDVEHVILRRNAYKYGLGYIRTPIFKGWLKKAMIMKHDFRIHFALNCGAVSCPAIGTYKVESLSEQLHLATLNFLEQECAFSENENTVVVSRLMLWFHADFGGHRGIRKILRHYGIIPPDSKPKIAFSAYNWTLKLSNFQK